MIRLRYVFVVAVSALCLTLTACKLGERQPPAPISDAGTSIGTRPSGTPQQDTGSQGAQAVYYTVQAGDSLYRIAQRYNQSWQDIASWNHITDPSALAVGTVLLVSPEGGAPQTGVSVTPSTTIEPSSVTAGVESRMEWAWPANGTLIGRFDGSSNKGIDIAGNAGDPVYAAADGRVAYVGDGLRGYGQLVIIKHNDVFVTAYAHNSRILVEENQVVRRGEKIAEMGNTDAPRVMLHFEVRQQQNDGSSAVDPLKYLPSR